MSEKQKRLARFDLTTLSKAKKLDNGFLKVPVFATRSGVFNYQKADGSILKEYRPPEEVFKRESMDSLAGVPVTNRHPAEMVDAKNAKKFMIGYTSDKIEKNDNFVATSVTITDEEVVREIENSGLRDVSCGYEADVDFVPGVTPDGERYDAVQRNIVYNHLAVVDRGRAGPEVRLRMDSEAAIMDDENLPSGHQGGSSGQKNTKRGDNMAKIKLNGAEHEVDSGLAAAIKAEITDAKETAAKEARTDEASKLETQLKQEKDQAQAKIDSLEEELKKAKESKMDAEDLHKAVLARTSLVEKAKKVVKEDTDLSTLTEQEIKRVVVAEKCPELKLDEKSETYIEARFDHIMETLDEGGEDLQKDLKKAIGDKATKKDEEEELSADKVRERNMKADSEAWKQPIGKSAKSA